MDGKSARGTSEMYAWRKTAQSGSGVIEGEQVEVPRNAEAVISALAMRDDAGRLDTELDRDLIGGQSADDSRSTLRLSHSE